eukprot:m.65862 g.65862  ORF g.65862 m.65862 type:complete len:112 (+) comp13564_c1_seq1:730-1065(+)
METPVGLRGHDYRICLFEQKHVHASIRLVFQWTLIRFVFYPRLATRARSLERTCPPSIQTKRPPISQRLQAEMQTTSCAEEIIIPPQVAKEDNQKKPRRKATIVTGEAPIG